MTILGTDPFDLLAYQQGLIATPLVEEGAGGADDLDVPQRSITIGEVIPIVFGRRVGTVGGVLISPGATEARFENDTANAVTATYHLVLSEGHLQPVQVRDVFQRSCRVGTFTQSFNRRGGSWMRGNFIVDRGGSFVKPEAPYYCGSGGTYAGMTTGSFSITAPDGDTRWDRQVHLFIRGGMYVTRLLDDTLGPSNNVADLALWLLRNTSRTPEALIDVPAFEAAASFTDQLGLWFNGEEKISTNFEDWLAANARYFLLMKSKRGGKTGLRPLLPTTSTNALQVSPVQPVFVFSERHIIPGSFEISYVPLNERKPFCALMLWRQQPEDDIGLIRTTEVRYGGTAENGPFEQHDLSVFATSENHAVKVGAYIVARRRYVTHTLRIKVRPASFNATLAQGDIVQVVMQRVASSAAAGEHRYLYEVDRIGKSRSGEVELNLTHFPVDALGRSLVALDVDAATGSGILLSTAKSGISCDVNADDDTTPAIDDGIDPFDPSDLDPGELPDLDDPATLVDADGNPIVDDTFDVVIPDTDFGTGSDGDGFVGGDGYGDGYGGGVGEGGEAGEAGEGGEPIDSQGDLQLQYPPGGPSVGDTITPPQICKNQTVRWIRDGQPIPNGTIDSWVVELMDVGARFRAIVECADGQYETEDVLVNPFESTSGVDRPISATWNVVSNGFGSNTCDDGRVVTPAFNSSMTISHSGFGVGYRVVRGSSFSAEVCSDVVRDSVTLPGMRIDLVTQSGATFEIYNGPSSGIIYTTVGSSSFVSGYAVASISGLTVTG